VEEAAARSQATLYALFIPVMLLVTAAVTLVIGAINQLAFIRRLPEFGTLHAVGRSKGWLARRLTLETAGLVLVGWALGIVASWGGMAVLSAAVYATQGFAFDPFQVMALLLVAPMPLAVIGFTLFTFSSMDHGPAFISTSAMTASKDSGARCGKGRSNSSSRRSAFSWVSR
jgi:ABC-type antimicrobial peptide transport system permease subunit